MIWWNEYAKLKPITNMAKKLWQRLLQLVSLLKLKLYDYFFFKIIKFINFLFVNRFIMLKWEMPRMSMLKIPANTRISWPRHLQSLKEVFMIFLFNLWNALRQRFCVYNFMCTPGDPGGYNMLHVRNSLGCTTHNECFRAHFWL